MEVKTRKKNIDSKQKILSATDLFPKSVEDQRVLRARAEHYAKKIQQVSETTAATSYIRFKISENEYYGIPYQFAKEVIHYINITKVPRVPDFVAGVINRRSTLMTVLDLKNLFHTSKNEYSNNSFIIIVQYKHLIVGILADSMEGSASYSNESLDPPIASEGILKPEYILGLHNGQTAIINIEVLLSDPDILIKKSTSMSKE